MGLEKLAIFTSFLAMIFMYARFMRLLCPPMIPKNKKWDGHMSINYCMVYWWSIVNF